MKIVALLLIGWFALSITASVFENMFFACHMKRLRIPFSFVRTSHLGYLSDVYRTWGEANGVDVDGRLKIRKYLTINMVLSVIGFAVGWILLEMSGTNPPNLP